MKIGSPPDMVVRDDTRQKVVILGASGFIGINLAHALVSRGIRPVLFARNLSPHWPKGCEVLTGDFSAPSPDLIAVMNGSVIFHLVSTSRPSGSTTGAAGEVVENIAATVRLLEIAKNLDCRWVFASSGGTVYGQPVAERIAEDHPTDPISSYGVSKLALEKYFQLYRTIHATDYVVTRISNPYGPFQSPATGQGLIATLFDRISRGVPVEIWGDGENVRDYVYIDDVVEALVAVAIGGKAGGIYNIGSGVGTSINALAPKISALLGMPAKLVYAPSRGIDVRRNVLDIVRISHELGWGPSRSLDEGIAETHRWLQQRAQDRDKQEMVR